ncbi:MAG TPA: hypothetical protein PKI84_06450 [Methanofastidiosum sp.]|jgi:hypothetical protein|nr:hypothetical protein [Methanofastidiosum sp.]HPU90576.1 hypothetical protein [Methanofastidiosum sp.]HQF89409.1 hypothetical protein [Methanofastidiosum sp.]HQG61958.1 hypothetical protein [Methanofastidiosum sp.]
MAKDSKLNVSIVEKRLQILWGSRLNENLNIKKALRIQEELRKKSGNWNGSAEVAKWRRLH